jgi:hypothetical protein
VTELSTRTCVSEFLVDADNERMDPTDIRRFWERVDTSAGPDACWPWALGRNTMGYGRFYLTGGRARLASRVAFVIANGREPKPGYVSCHTCDNPPCCNPAHLYEGTFADNRRDAVLRMRGLR